MFPIASSHYISTTGFIERDRRASGRPASRSEILSRHQEESKVNSSFYIQDQMLRNRSKDLDREVRRHQQLNEARRAGSNPSVRVRHTIGKVLIAAGERIRPELA